MEVSRLCRSAGRRTVVASPTGRRRTAVRPAPLPPAPPNAPAAPLLRPPSASPPERALASAICRLRKRHLRLLLHRCMLLLRRMHSSSTAVSSLHPLQLWRLQRSPRPKPHLTCSRSCSSAALIVTRAASARRRCWSTSQPRLEPPSPPSSCGSEGNPKEPPRAPPGDQCMMLHATMPFRRLAACTAAAQTPPCPWWGSKTSLFTLK